MEALILNGSKPTSALKRLAALASMAKGRSKAEIQDTIRALGGRLSNSPARGRSAQENPMSKKKKATARKTVAKKRSNPTTKHHHKNGYKRRSNPTRLAGLDLGGFLVDASAVVAGGIAHGFAKKQTSNFLPSMGATTASVIAGVVVGGGALWASKKFGKYRSHLEHFAAGVASSAIKDVASHFAPSLFAGLGDTGQVSGYFDPQTGQWVQVQLNGSYGDSPDALPVSMAGAYFDEGAMAPELTELYD
ncbi:MAG: hypothetical protein JST05_01150 [Acidobacteria bacterium]|nr:hypothetical protein [Acidobacteriota bacterium]